MPMSGGGQIDARRRADLLMTEIDHKELRQERWSPYFPSGNAANSLKHNTRRGFIYGLIGIVLVALFVGLVWFLF